MMLYVCKLDDVEALWAAVTSTSRAPGGKGSGRYERTDAWLVICWITALRSSAGGLRFSN